MSYYFDLCHSIAAIVKMPLVEELRKTGFIGDTNLNPKDLKSTHKVDLIADKAIREFLNDKPCNVFLESFDEIIKDDARFSVFIDPIDGSLNWDRGIGDPCITIAIAERLNNWKFSDLVFSYVEGFRSGDIYYCENGNSYFQSQMLNSKSLITCKTRKKLSEATVYLRSGYSLASEQFKKTFPLYLLSKDTRAIDNAGTEICEIARNAADAMVEARGASDVFNVLAFPILKSAGGVLMDFEGEDFDNKEIVLTNHYDYIAAGNRLLADEIRAEIAMFQRRKSFNKNGIELSMA